MVITDQRIIPTSGDALLIADIQNDFLPGGALGVPSGDQIVPVVARYIEQFQRQGLPVHLTRDWHPANHCSFREQGGIWPVHCVAGSRGAEPPPSFPAAAGRTILKATRPDREAYSAFEGTDLHQELRAAQVRRLFVGGLATDYCVLNTVRDARRLGYEVVLLVDAIRAVDLRPGDGLRAEAEMMRLGAVPLRFDELSA